MDSLFSSVVLVIILAHFCIILPSFTKANEASTEAFALCSSGNSKRSGNLSILRYPLSTPDASALVLSAQDEYTKFDVSTKLLAAISTSSLHIFHLNYEDVPRQAYNKVKITTDVRSPSAVAINPTNHYVYWVDSKLLHLEVISVLSKTGKSLQTPHRKILLERAELKHVEHLIVDASSQKIYYYSSNVTVYESSLDGSFFSRKDVGVKLTMMSMEGYLDTGDLYYFSKASLYDENSSKLFSRNVDSEPLNFVAFNDSFYFAASNKGIQVYNRKGLMESHFATSCHITSFQIMPKSTPHTPCASHKCSHFCFDQSESDFSCSCPTGVGLIENSTSLCKAEVENFVLFTDNITLYEYSLDVPKSYSREVFSISQSDFTSITYDPSSHQIFYSVENFHSKSESFSIFYRSNLDGSDAKLIGDTRPALGHVKHVAYDWVSANMYFTTTSSVHLGVMDMKKDVGRVKILFKDAEISQSFLLPKGADKGTDRKLCSLAIDPLSGYLFVGDGSHFDLIYRLSLDGSKVELVDNLRAGIAWPDGMAVDVDTKSLYVLDAFEHELHVMDYFGQSYSFVMQVPQERNDVVVTGELAIYGKGNKFFTSANGGNHVVVKMFQDVTNETEVLKEIKYSHAPTDLIIGFQVVRKKVDSGGNACSQNECTNFCFYVEGESKCGCPDNMDISRVDANQCLPKEPSFVYANSTSVYFLSPFTLSASSPVPCHFKGLFLHQSLSFDPRLKVLFFIGSKIDEKDAMSIYRCVLSNDSVAAKPEPVIKEMAYDWMTYDWKTELLFWFNPLAESIIASSSDGKYHRVVVEDVENPLAGGGGPLYHDSHLYFFQEEQREMYLVDAKIQGKITKDSKESHKIDGLALPASLTLDFQSEKIYWLEQSEDSLTMRCRDIARLSEKDCSVPVDSSYLTNALVKLFIQSSKIFYMESSQFFIGSTANSEVLSSVDLAMEDMKSIVGVAGLGSGAAAEAELCFASDENRNKLKCAQMCFKDRVVSQTGQPSGNCYCDYRYKRSEQRYNNCTLTKSNLVAFTDSKKIFKFTGFDIESSPYLEADLGQGNTGNRFDKLEELLYDPYDSSFYLLSDQGLYRYKKGTLDQIFVKDNMKITSAALDPLSRLLFCGNEEYLFACSLVTNRVVFEYPKFSEVYLQGLSAGFGLPFIVANFYRKPRYEGPQNMGAAEIDFISINGSSPTQNKPLRGLNSPKLSNIDPKSNTVFWTSSFPKFNIRNFNEEGSWADSMALSADAKGYIQDAVYSFSAKKIIAIQGKIVDFALGSETAEILEGRASARLGGASKLAVEHLLDGAEMSQAEFCQKSACSHFCSPRDRTCFCPQHYFLSSDLKTCQKYHNLFSCAPGQRVVPCDSSSCSPHTMMCSSFANGTCAPDQDSCSSGDLTPGSGAVVCFQQEQWCQLRPNFCQCLPLYSKLTDKGSGLNAVWSSVIACIGLIMLILGVFIVFAVWKRRKRSPCDRKPADGSSLIGPTVGYNPALYGNEVNLNMNSPTSPASGPIGGNGGCPTPTYYSTLKSTQSHNFDTRSSSHNNLKTELKSKKVNNTNQNATQAAVANNTRCMSSSCSTLNNVNWCSTPHAPPPTPQAMSVISSDPEGNTNTDLPPPYEEDYCVHCRHAGPGPSQRQSRQGSSSRQKNYDRSVNGGVLSGEESEPLFMPKPGHSHYLPSGSRFSDRHSHTLGRFVKSRRRYVWDEITYTRTDAPHAPPPQHGTRHGGPEGGPTRGSSSRHHTPPAPACTPLSGSQEYLPSIHEGYIPGPPSPSASGVSGSTVHVRVVHVHNHHDPPPSPVSNV